MLIEADQVTEAIPASYRVPGSKPVINIIEVETVNQDSVKEFHSILDSKMQTLVCPVNCKGVMGKGLARQFAIEYPEFFEAYAQACIEGKIKIGKPINFRWDDGKQIIAFPTKDDWRNDSKFWYITRGLSFLLKHYKELGIESIAFPALGCGNGHLIRENVINLIKVVCNGMNIDAEIYV